MKKKVWTIMISILAVFACVFAFAACDSNRGGSGSDGSENSGENGDNKNPPITDTNDSELYEAYADVYYCDTDEYIVFTEDKIWYDNTGATGKYDITKNGNIKFNLYADLTNNNVEYTSGILYDYMYGYNNKGYISFGRNGNFYKGYDKPIPECPKSLDYEISEDGTNYKVTDVGKATGDIVVPKRYRFLPVKEIADRAFSNTKAVTSVEVPINVTTIGERVFEKCTSLTEVKIYAGIDEFGEEMFSGCTKLEDVHISGTVKEINYRAFKYCEKVQNVYYGGTVKDWAEIKFGISGSHASSNMGSEEPYWANPISRSGRKLIINDSVVTSCELENVNAGAFFLYKYLTNVEVTGAVGDYAFYYSSISSLSAGSIGISACEGCHNLESFSGGGMEIGNNAFFDCTAMTDVSLGSSLVTIGEHAFASCEKLTDVTIPVSVLLIGRYAFSGTALNNVVFEYYTDTTGLGMYGPSEWIVNKGGEIYIDVSESQSRAAKYLVNNDSNNGYTAYDWQRSSLAFILNSDGNSYGVACNITPWSNWSTPAHINIPSVYKGKPVTEITGSTVCQGFRECHNLKSIFIPQSIIKTGYCPFEGCNNLTLYCEASSAPSDWSYYNIIDRYDPWTKIPVVWNCKNNDKDEDGYAYTVIDGFKYRVKDTTAELLCDVMEGCRIYGKRVIPQSITYADKKYAVKSIGEEALYNRYNSQTLTNIVISDGVTSIGDLAFAGCGSLTSMTIPNTVTSIGACALQGCNSLEEIIFNGTIAQWDAIEKGDNWNFCTFCRIYCTDGEPQYDYIFE